MLTVLIGMTAIAIDGARAYTLRRDLQAAVDSAALAAADKLQQTGNYATAEQTCSPATYGSTRGPRAHPVSVLQASRPGL
jgi:Flp pilus assembly protein TadG